MSRDLDRERWRRVSSILDAVLTLPVEARAAQLDEACNGDAELRRLVEDLLAAESAAGAFLEQDALERLAPLAADVDGAEAIPEVGEEETIVGAYRLLHKLGEGGMGTVYLAERVDGQFEQQVAVKLLKQGLPGADARRRFLQERQILARLEHPGIARLLDGGVTAEGTPFFVMEKVEGRPVTAYCNEQDFGIGQRLHVFLEVCAAVQYAQHNLVVHRDLKPSNILVGPGGRVKLLDFGIAKLLVEAEDAPGEATRTAVRAMTLEYAAPEQVRGDPVTTATDVYSMGVVLYEMLAGQSPYRVGRERAHELQGAILEQEPLRPSACTGAAAGGLGLTLAEQRRRLRGDLDGIVLKALEKSPARRYPSAEALAADIRRHLAGLPVSARQETLGYRAGKFVRRNTLATVSAALIFLTLVGGIVATTWQVRRATQQEELARAAQARAEQRFNDVRRLARAVLFDYHDAIKDLAGATKVRERLVKDGLEYLDTLAGEKHNDTTLQRELASAYERVGDVQGDTSSGNLGDTAGALVSYRKARALRQAVLAAEPRSAAARRELAHTHEKLSGLLSQHGDVAGAAAAGGKAIALLEALVSEGPADQDLRFELAYSYDNAGVVSLDANEVERSLRQHRRAVELYESLAPTRRDSPNVRREMPRAYQHLAQALTETGDLDQALLQHRKALPLRVALAAEFPMNVDYRGGLFSSYYYEGDVLDRMGRNREAFEAFHKAATVSEQLLAADPGNDTHRGNLAFALLRAGNSLARLGEHAEALSSYRRALVLRAEDLNADPANLWKRTPLIETHARIGLTLARLGQRDAALAACENAQGLINTTAVEPDNIAVGGAIAEIHSALGEAYATLASDRGAPESQSKPWWRAARQAYRRSFDFWRGLHERGMLSGVDAAKPEAVARQVARCDAALAQ